jgi:CheY-like chemotaxis protein
MGFDVIPVESGAKMMILLGMIMPDVLLLGIKIPHAEGLKVLSRIKQDMRTSLTPVIMISEESDGEIRQECLRLGCSGFLTRPVELAELNDLLWNVIVLPGGRRRRHLRVGYEKKVAITYNGVTQNYYAVSLSEGGIYVRRRSRLPLGSRVEVTLSLENHDTFRLKGVVSDERGLYGNLFKVAPGMTIDFREMSKDQMARLRAHIADLLVGDILEEPEEPYITIHQYRFPSSSTSLVR